jgi:hypothetical protein
MRDNSDTQNKFIETKEIEYSSFQFKRELNALFEIELLTKKKTMDKVAILRLISRDSYTKIGKNNFEEVFKIMFKKIESDISKLNIGKDRRVMFWDLFLDRSNYRIVPYPDKHYKKFFKNNSRFYKSLRLDRVCGYKWDLIDERSFYSNYGIKIHPLKTAIISDSIVGYLEKQMEASENEFRRRHDFPLIGEEVIKWKSENELYMLLQANFSNEIVEQQASPSWLNNQHLDIYFPHWNIAIEYQGRQHFEAIDFFGGEEAFKKNLERDERKRNLCKKNQCSLFYVKKGYEIDDVIKKINDVIITKEKFLDNEYTTKKVAEVSEISEIGSNREIYDCKTQQTITYDEFIKEFPKAQFEYFIKSKSVYSRFILKSKLSESDLPGSWKTIRNTNTEEIFRFNKIEFAKYLDVSQNSVWRFFVGKQKKFHKIYEIIED